MYNWHMLDAAKLTSAEVASKNFPDEIYQSVLIPPAVRRLCNSEK
jgi:hypothetical protein